MYFRILFNHFLLDLVRCQKKFIYIRISFSNQNHYIVTAFGNYTDANCLKKNTGYVVETIFVVNINFGSD